MLGGGESSCRCVPFNHFPAQPQGGEGRLRVQDSLPQSELLKEDHVLVMKQLILLHGGPCDK